MERVSLRTQKTREVNGINIYTLFQNKLSIGNCIKVGLFFIIIKKSVESKSRQRAEEGTNTYPRLSLRSDLGL